MIFKACGFRPRTFLFRIAQILAWRLFQRRAHSLQKAAA